MVNGKLYIRLGHVYIMFVIIRCGPTLLKTSSKIWITVIRMGIYAQLKPLEFMHIY